MPDERIIHPSEDLSQDTTASFPASSYGGEDEVGTPQPAANPYEGNENHSTYVSEQPTEINGPQGQEDRRIEDPDKAHTMAIAGDAWRTEAAGARQQAEQLGHKGEDYLANESKLDAVGFDHLAEKDEEQASRRYDEQNAQSAEPSNYSEHVTQVIEPVAHAAEPAQPEAPASEVETANSDQELVSYWQSVLSKNPISNGYLQYVHVDPNILEDEGAALDKNGKLTGVSAENLARLEAREKVFIKEAGDALELAHGYDDDSKLPELMAEIIKMKGMWAAPEDPKAAQAEKLFELLQNRITTMDDLRQCWHNFHSNIAKEKLGVALTIGGFLDDVRTGQASKTDIQP